MRKASSKKMPLEIESEEEKNVDNVNELIVMYKSNYRELKNTILENDTAKSICKYDPLARGFLILYENFIQYNTSKFLLLFF